MNLSLLLATLKQNKAYISGEYLSEILAVSRNSIWKGIAKLREMGYIIQTKKAVGYMLINNNELLNYLEIENIFDLRQSKNIKREFAYFDEIDSTNTYLKQTSKNLPSGYFVVAQTQTKGRGRLNRSFYSLSGKGVYISYLYKKPIPISQLSLITITAACAVINGLKAFGINNGEIKWPNDIYVSNKKVCGILSEISIEAESGILTKAIIGMGINANEVLDDFISEIQDIVTSMYLVSGVIINRSELVYEIICQLDKLLTKDEDEILALYKSSLILNKKFKFTYNNKQMVGTAFNVTKQGALEVELESGKQISIVSGDIEIYE